MPLFNKGVVGTNIAQISFGRTVKSFVVVNDNETGSALEVFSSNNDADKFLELNPGEYVVIDSKANMVYIRGKSGNVNYRVMGI